MCRDSAAALRSKCHKSQGRSGPRREWSSGCIDINLLQDGRHTTSNITYKRAGQSCARDPVSGHSTAHLCRYARTIHAAAPAAGRAARRSGRLALPSAAPVGGDFRKRGTRGGG